MRRLQLSGLGFEASAVGFGCASLGSRVSARAGLDALSRAYDGGVTWYDLAPAYGAGEAERLFSAFLRPRRDTVQILTKVGLAPPGRSGLLRAGYSIARPFAGLLGSLRGAKVARNRAERITPALIETSIQTSLRRLGTDHVEVLALHDPDPETVTRDDVLGALEQAVKRGQAQAVGIAGSLDACLAGAACGLPYQVFQTATDPVSDRLAAIRRRAGRPVTTIGHSVMRGDGGADAAAARLRAALAANWEGITLLSMFSASHLVANLALEREVAVSHGQASARARLEATP